MPDETMSDQAAVEAQGTEQAASEVTSQSQTSETVGSENTSATAGQQWKFDFGGNTYTDPNKFHEAAKKWEAEVTRKNQERAQRDRDTANKIGQYESVVAAINRNPALRDQVVQAIKAGMPPQQAIQQAAEQNLPPEVMQRIGFLEGREREREQGAAIDDFAKSHKELTEKEWGAIEGWLKENESWCGNLPPNRQLALAYSEAVVPTLSARWLEMGQKQKEEEIKNGGKSAFLGSQAPTAGAKPTGLPERPRHATPAQERDWAQKVFRANANKK
jgi:hypothetical protein